MPKNIEIKAKVHDSAKLRLRAEEISRTPAQVIFQEDTFFCTLRGRMKLRVIGNDRGELIFYQRADQNGAKESDYVISVTTEPHSLKEVLTGAYGVQGVIRKRRELYLVGQTRIHIDEVEGLGEFVELEYIMQTDETSEEGMRCQ
jgi:predicted adenylyl cyclase CyaB